MSQAIKTSVDNLVLTLVGVGGVEYNQLIA